MLNITNKLTTALIVPALSLSILAVQPAMIDTVAYAQQVAVGDVSQRPDRVPEFKDNGENYGKRIVRKLRPCPPNFKQPATHLVECRPWTPPRVQVSSEKECECKVRRVNGQLIKDCYVMVRNLVHYCKKNQLFRTAN